MMTSRERVRTVLRGEIPDHIPVDIGGSTLTGIHVDEYIELGEYLGIDCHFPKVMDQYQMLARVEGLMRDWFKSDVVAVENPSISWGYENKDWKPWKTQHGHDVLVPGKFRVEPRRDGMLQLYNALGKLAGEMPVGGCYFDRIFPDACADLMDGIKMMDPDDFKKTIPLYTDEELRLIQRRAEFLDRHTDYSVLGEFLRGNLGTSGVFAGHLFTQWMCVTVLEPEYAFSLVQACAERTIENFDLYRQAVGSHIDTIFVSATDFGTQNNEFYSPDTFCEIYLPNYRRINEHIHKHSHFKTIFHSCGSIRKTIPLMIEAGVDILNPVQIGAHDMDAAELKATFGKRLIFWGGGIDAQTVYPNGTPDEVREHVRRRIEIMGKEGGYVFSPVHNTQYGVPPANIEAMLETVRTYGKY